MIVSLSIRSGTGGQLKPHRWRQATNITRLPYTFRPGFRMTMAGPVRGDLPGGGVSISGDLHLDL